MYPPMLLQASKLYTPIIFGSFQEEYERSLALRTKAIRCGGDDRWVATRSNATTTQCGAAARTEATANRWRGGDDTE
jgi:hypothetical protein